jgi:hypothetical protein
MVYIEKGSFIKPGPLTVYVLWGLYYAVGPELGFELLSTQGSIGGLAAIILVYVVYVRRKNSASNALEGHGLTENDLDSADGEAPSEDATSRMCHQYQSTTDAGPFFQFFPRQL